MRALSEGARRRLGRVGFVAAEVLVFLTIGVLAVTGFRAVLDTTGGQVVDAELEPDEPGYESVAARTPVALVVGLDPAGGLDWVTVLALSGADEQGGDILLLPTASVVVGEPDGGVLDGDETATDQGATGGEPRTLAEVWANDGQGGLTIAVAALLGASFSDVVVVDQARVVTLLGPVAPLALDNPDPVVVVDDAADDGGEGDGAGETTVAIEAGSVTLAAAEIPTYLGGPAPEQSDLARLVRHQVFWPAWLAAVAAADDPGVVPGETDMGLARYVRGLAGGPVAVDVVPVTARAGAEPGVERFDVDLAAARDLVNERIAFPAAATPGARVQVRVLDGVGRPGLAEASARAAVVGIGAEITVLGNAERFGMTASRVVWIDEPDEAAARRLARALGVTEVVRGTGPNPFDDVDLTLVVGTDLADAYRSGSEALLPPPPPDGGDPPG